MENEEMERGVAFGGVVKIVLKKIWYVLGAAALVAVVAVLAFSLWLNPSATNYTMDFILVYPASDTGRNPDGTAFYYQDMISAEYLKEALVQTREMEEDAAEELANKMVRAKAVKIVAEQKQVSGVTTNTGRYTLTVKGSYFADGAAGEKFIRAVAELPVKKIIASAGSMDYSLSENVFSGASFETRLARLTEQREMLLAQYDGWIKYFSGSYAVNGATLQNLRVGTSVVFDEHAQKSLTGELARGGYIPLPAEGADAVLAEERKQLKAEYEVNQATIEAMKGAMNGESSSTRAVGLAVTSNEEKDYEIIFPEEELNLSQSLAKLIERNQLIATQLGNYATGASDDNSGTLTKENIQAFEQKLNAQYAKLNQAAEGLKNVTKALYETNTSVRFESEKVESTGGTSIILVAVGAFLVAFLAASFIVYLLAAAKSKKAQPAQQIAETPTERNEE